MICPSVGIWSLGIDLWDGISGIWLAGGDRRPVLGRNVYLGVLPSYS